MSSPKQQTAEQLFTGSSEMAKLMRSLDWSQTPLGRVETWSPTLCMIVRFLLVNRFPLILWWGSEYIQFYNDPYCPIPGTKHPKSMGQAASECWAEIWHVIGPLIDRPFQGGPATWMEDILLEVNRHGFLEETHFTIAYSPVPDETAPRGIGGVLGTVHEITEKVVGERRVMILHDLGARGAEAKTAAEACAIAAETLVKHAQDIPFALLYLLEPDGPQAQLSGVTGTPIDEQISPRIVNLNGETHSDWPLSQALETETMQVVEDLSSRFAWVPPGPWSDPPHTAVVLPIPASKAHQFVGLLIVGISARLRLDESYRNFLELMTLQIATGIANARAYEEERKRAEALAEVDRAKTIFFSNVSHEFRTPLTLMLGPTEDALNDSTAPLPPNQRDRIELIQRNGQRLLKLVNTLLDFSRIEAGRVEAVYEPTDLAAFTAELASVFRSAIERANLLLVVDCPPLPEAVYIDREMWEKIVLNLLSNAFKFTFSGEIAVRLKWMEAIVTGPTGEDCGPDTLCPEPAMPKRAAVLEVHDTGIGIPASELPHLFKRFHRVRGAQGRSFEGSGIGLSLVQELVKLHQGTIEVNSVAGEGTCFAIAIPAGTAHLPQDRIRATRTLSSTASGVNAYIEEALRWLPDASAQAEAVSPDFNLIEPQVPEPTLIASESLPSKAKASILLADDNADMRDYIQRLLSQQYQVEAVSDGLAALNSIQDHVPDLVLTDIMMPRLDGFGLLQTLRAAPQTRELPIILLSARAGEEARIEGLAAGADDYLIKPFSGRELLARVEASLKLAQLRREALQREQTLRVASEVAQQQAEAAFGRINQILESMSDAFIALDQNWRIVYQNAMSEQINGKSRSEVLGKTLWEEWPAASGSIFEQQYRRAVVEQIPVHFEQHYYEPPDHDVWLEMHAYPFKEGLGIFYRDISDRKRAEKERERLLAQEQAARAEAEQANRIKDEFLAMLSHELRAPLTPILGWSKLLGSDKLDTAMVKQATAAIERNAKLQSDLIEDLLDMSRILQGKLNLNCVPVNLAIAIQAAAETVQLAAQAKSIQIDIRLAVQELFVLGDSTRLQQVVWNLLSNAVKFTPSKGRISVQLEQVGNEAQVTVSDTGKGISPDFLPYVFDYFRQEDSKTTRNFGGLGIGLAIVRRIVELHGGTIEADSLGEGLGAIFTLQLPIVFTPTQTEAESASDKPACDLKGIQVLVIDDDVDSREFLAFFLKTVGASVTTAASASEGLLIIMQSPPGLILSDIGMPDMDGYMLMQQVRALPPEQGGQVKAIALTGFAGEVDKQQALAAGFQHHLSKPVDPNELMRAIAALVIENS